MKIVTPIFLLIALISCNGQTKNSVKKEPSVIITDTLNLKKTIEENEGIVYFSYDNGVNWENKSYGLPDKISIGLDGIATSSTSLGIASKEYGVFLYNFKTNSWENIPTDSKIIQSNLGALFFYRANIYVGTQYGGVFTSPNQGETWTSNNQGLGNLTIRRFFEIDNILYVGTNDGIYSFNEAVNKWELEYGNSTLQVNGITELDGNILIGTNQGAFMLDKELKKWEQVFSNVVLHNISAFDNAVYAMTYNVLFSSTDKGVSWQSMQKGLPKELYTFNVIKNNKVTFAGQWDGVYRKDNLSGEWISSSNGLPKKFAVTNFKVYNGILVISCSERKLRTGMTTEK
ncbi:MAG: hypothetical protein M0P66_04720 [Salinivirgaceae bacterium]|nr:hypothetical protein [Salinivirgaceae bacterium]